MGAIKSMKEEALSGAIVLSGGNTIFRGFKERLETELAEIGGNIARDYKIITSTNQRCSSWIGASIEAKLDSSSGISKE